ncbi:hypothetical protein VF14_21735 [Nostoc linckia z18]|uniref:Uncharacterized protein n=2 Tax=Nostoc linckia TaxID=92942 RepID=A0A9Q5ZAA9_NOSLI|nr:hypothetical protein [Nostoc linckia]PHK40482.1 hypothetical protein VF12_10285 [Nostoc linckia z15]PHK44371.1 hypothetical protein VF13_22130 [Nostoc linckia z16]PHJ57174.1 hypothetical protein VF02_31055 [Nostoc linckia z1]PHJ59650.1 hypothetical protein VF05_31810 [Nostoc linckia z3]PHJ63950.1 hypothetical protein VF03_29660 [Nostoc linckia z2]
MPDKFTNNVRARLYKQGYQGFTKDDYKSAALAVECDDLDNPTKEQLSQAVDYLKAKVTSQLSVADEPVEEKFLTQVEAETELETGKLAVAPQDVGEMIVNKAAVLGVILSEQQINDIADSVDTSASTFDEILEQVETALLAYADLRANQVDAKIDRTLSRVQERVVNRHEQSRDKLSLGLTGISAALESSRNQTKSQLSGIKARLNAAQ